MSQRPTLDASSFEKLLAAAWVLQCQQIAAAQNRVAGLSPEPRESSHGNGLRGAPVAALVTALPAPNTASPSAGNENSFSWAVARGQWAAAAGPVVESDQRVSALLQQAYPRLPSTVIGAVLDRRLQKQNGAPVACEAKSSQQLPPAAVAKTRPATPSLNFSRHLIASWERAWPLAQRSLSEAAESAKSRLQSLARYRIKVRFAFRPRHAVEAAGASFSLLLMVLGFTLFQVWHRDRFPVVAATTGVERPVEKDSKADHPVQALQLPVSHGRVTDVGVLVDVQSLSPYEIPALRRQADYGDDSAALVLGMLYETGRYVPQSCKHAAEWVAKSADWGNPAAQYNLGLRYRDGDGVSANPDQAQKWLRRAGHQKYAKAGLALETIASRDARSSSTP